MEYECSKRCQELYMESTYKFIANQGEFNEEECYEERASFNMCMVSRENQLHVMDASLNPSAKDVWMKGARKVEKMTIISEDFRGICEELQVKLGQEEFEEATTLFW